ncbi:MAG: RDD family protein [Ornithinibacter sp.]
MSDEMPPPPPPPPPPGYAAQPPTGPRPGELLDRFLARLIDGIIIAVVYFVLAAIVAVIIRSGLLRGVIDAVLSAALYLGYFAYMESSQGKTIGKSVLKLRVLGPAGGNPTMEQAIRRNIWTAFGIAGIIPILGAVIGAVAQLVAVVMIAIGISNDTVNRQAWNDKFAGGTRVIKEG